MHKNSWNLVKAADPSEKWHREECVTGEGIAAKSEVLKI
jgi:hypothetical protein